MSLPLDLGFPELRRLATTSKALSVLVYVVGLPATTPVRLAEDEANPAEGLSQDSNAWLGQAQARHPAMAAARAQLESAQEKVTATPSEGLPTLEVRGSRTRGDC